jgi:heme exporter protein B
LYIPVLIFGAGAVEATVSGLGEAGHISMLGAIFLLSLVMAPLATVAALRISAE